MYFVFRWIWKQGRALLQKLQEFPRLPQASGGAPPPTLPNNGNLSNETLWVMFDFGAFFINQSSK